MGLLKDFYQHELYVRKRYWPREILNPMNWKYAIQHRRQRANRGWSYRDTWNGGEYIAEVAAGILYKLNDDQNPIDWDEYFKQNYEDNYGYTSLTEVADDLQLYIDWAIIQWEEPLYSELRNEDRWAMDIQVYAQAQNAMHFIASNLGGLWW